MHTRWITLHHCRKVEEVDDGKPFACTCRTRITTRDSKKLIAGNVAVRKLRWVGDHRPPVEDQSQLVLIDAQQYQQHSIRSLTITKHEMENLAARQPYAIERTERYGDSVVKLFVGLGAEGLRASSEANQTGGK